VTTDGAAARLGPIVANVCGAAAAESGAPGIMLLEPDTPEGALIAGWLSQWQPGLRVWRGGGDTGNVVQEGASADALMAHPANKTVLLLGGRLPRADLFPVGDVWAWQVADLTGGWTGPQELRRLAEDAGGIVPLDRALSRLVEERLDGRAATAELPEAVAAELLTRYETGRYWRLRPRLTPKLTSRTLDIDLFD
jgi:hypothetical protein